MELSSEYQTEAEAEADEQEDKAWIQVISLMSWKSCGKDDVQFHHSLRVAAL